MDSREKSFAAASEASKLLITLATGVIVFCVTLVNFKQGDATSLAPGTGCQKLLLACSWAALLLCTGSGIWVQLSITHVLSEDSDKAPVGVWNMKIRFPFMLQIISFVFGMTLLVAYGAWKLFG